MAANTAEVRETALSLDAAFSDERAARLRPERIANGRQGRRLVVRRDQTRIVAAALIVSAIGCLVLSTVHCLRDELRRLSVSGPRELHD